MKSIQNIFSENTIPGHKLVFESRQGWESKIELVVLKN